MLVHIPKVALGYVKGIYKERRDSEQVLTDQYPDE